MDAAPRTLHGKVGRMTREEAIRKLQKQKAEYLEEWVDFSGVAEAYDMAIEALSAKAAQSEQQWIPVTGRPPEHSDWVNVTVIDESGDSMFRYTTVGWYLSDGYWIVDNEPMQEDSSLIRVVAWRELPAPWKGDAE